VSFSESKQIFHNQPVLILLVLWLIMNDGFSFDSSITCFEGFRVAWVNRGYIAADRRQNLKPNFAQVPEQSQFTYSAYLVAAGHLSEKLRRACVNPAVIGGGALKIPCSY